MSVTYATATKNSRMTAVRDDIDAGASSPNVGYIEIGTASMAAVLVTIPFAIPSGTIAAGVLTFSGTPLSADATGTGTAVEARIRDSDATDIVTGLTVGLATDSPLPDIQLDNTSISSGQTVNITAASITHG